MADQQLTGGCGCGAVRFTLSAPLQAAAYCHCTRCQRRTGTASQASGLAEPGSLSVVEGEEHLARWVPDGGGFEKVFCSQCGSAWIHRSRPPHDPAWLRREPPAGHPKGTTLSVPGRRPPTRPAGPWNHRSSVDPGSALYGENPEDRDVVTVRLGAIDGDPGIRPAARQFVAYAAVWEPIPDDGLPRYDERIPSR